MDKTSKTPKESQKPEPEKTEKTKTPDGMTEVT